MLVIAHIAFARGRRDDSEQEARTQFGSMQGALLGLLGLQLGFLVSMAEGRFAQRRQLIVKEANAIGTLYLRADFFPPAEAAVVRDLIRAYTDARIAFYDAGANDAAEARAISDSQRLQGELWSHATSLVTSSERGRTGALFVSVINDVIDLESERRVAVDTHVPATLVLLLVVVAAVAIWALSYSWALARKKSIVGVSILPVLVGLAICVVLDLDSPRVGVLRVGQRAMLDARAAMNQH